MGVCWFCGNNQGDHDFEVVMSRNLLVGGTSFEKKYVHSEQIVPIPRCRQCAYAHRLRTKVRFIFLFLSIGLAAFIIIPLVIINSDIAGSLIPLIIVAISVVVVMAAGEIYRKKKWPEFFSEGKIKFVSTFSLSKHPMVASLEQKGFTQEAGKTEKLNKGK